jgi:hypothetical protein
VEAEDGAAIRRGLTRWGHVGGDAEGLLQRRFPEGHPAIRPLKRSIHQTGTAKSNLYAKGKQAFDLGECLAAMDKAVQALGPLIEELHSRMGDADE